MGREVGPIRRPDRAELVAGSNSCCRRRFIVRVLTRHPDPRAISSKEKHMYHSGLNIVIGLYVEISSRCSGHGGHWGHGLLGLFS
jgi:hypothetical protein